jgi:hypothetical protein
LDNRQVILDGVAAIEIEWLISDQTFVWNRTPSIEPSESLSHRQVHPRNESGWM